MKRDVTLRITSKQYKESLERSGAAFRKILELDDSVEIMTEGTAYSKNNATFIAYNESEEAGLTNSKTLLKLTDKALEIIRYGKDNESNMDMVLEAGTRRLTHFKVPMVGTFEIELYTHSVASDLGEDGYGTINADYRVRYDEHYSRRTKLEIEVRPS